MSATMHLFKIAEGVKVVPAKYYSGNKEEVAEIDKAWDEMKKTPDYFSGSEESQKLFNEFSKKYLEDTFSDGKDHEMIYLFFDKNERSHRIYKYYSYMKNTFKDYISSFKSCGTTCNVIPVDTVCYCQGWMFSKEFFKKTNTQFFAFSKDEMVQLLDKYLYSTHFVEIAPCYAKSEGFDKKEIDEYGNVHYYIKEHYDIEEIKDRFVKAYDESDGKYVFEMSW